MQKEKVINKLEELGISYELVEHKAVFTIEDMENLDVSIFKGAQICKNLFLRDAKGKRHFLVVVPAEKKVDLSILPEKIESTRLSFASPERLMKYLKLESGHVSPLAVINDEENKVEVIIDKQLKENELLAVHPNDNSYTVLLKYEDIIQYITHCGNDICYVTI